jgi:hypothetical protein
MKPTFRAVLVLIALGAGALSSRAQITFTLTTTADATGGGYNAGQTYQFTYTLAPTWSNNGASSYTATTNNWTEDNPANDQLFTSVSGSGLGGTFARPSAPYSYIANSSTGNLQLYASADGAAVTGLTTLSGTPLRGVGAQVDTAISFATPGSYTDPATSFASVLGTYAATGSILLNTGTVGYDFTISGLTIASPIPEPSTYAALLGMAALAWGIRRRHLAARSRQ